MNNVSLLAAVVAIAVSSSFARAETVPCEDALKALRALEQTAKPNDADKAKAAELTAQGIERCNADDDKRADEFFTQATQLLSK